MGCYNHYVNTSWHSWYIQKLPIITIQYSRIQILLHIMHFCMLPYAAAAPIYRTASLLRPARCYAPPPPPIFGRNYCKGLFYLHYTPPPAGRSSRFAVLQFCTYTRVASVEELYLCIKRVENSLRTGLGLFR